MSPPPSSATPSSVMRVVLTILCRDEADIIASTIAFHRSRGVHQLIVTDNGSVDGTRELLEASARRGEIHLLHEPSHTHDQAVWVSRMAALAYSSYGADWVIHADADEFWWPRAGCLGDALGEAAAAGGDVRALRVERRNFLPPDPLAPPGPFHSTQTIRERRSFNALGRPLPPKVCHVGHGDVTVHDGNHGVSLDGSPLAAKACSSLEIMHFPVRSCAQLERKIRDGATALARNDRVGGGVGGSWRHLHQRAEQEGGLSRYYASLRPTAEAFAAGLRSGELVEDRRLQQAMETISGHLASSTPC